MLNRTLAPPLLAALLTTLIAGCCADNPDGIFCGDPLAETDAGLGCWSLADEPIATTATLFAPENPSILGCDAMTPAGFCAEGAITAGESFGHPPPAESHVPAGQWTATARTHDCPGRDCELRVGVATTELHEAGFLGQFRDPRYRAACFDLPRPGRRPPPPGPFPPDVSDAYDCAELAGITITPLVDEAWELVPGVYNQQPPPESITGAEHARRAERFLDCFMARCAARNTWQGDVRRVDVDGDRVHRRCDVCPLRHDPAQLDADGDGYGDDCDNCPHAPGPQVDIDGDGVGDLCDLCPERWDDDQRDRDGDGVGDACDRCPGVPDPDQRDSDADRVGDACDGCPDAFDPDQTDRDDDRLGDACDPCPVDAIRRDGDADGVHDGCDVCPAVADPEQRDTDGDGLGDACECVAPEGDEARCWLEGDETAPVSALGLPGMIECPEGEAEPKCTQQARWPTIQAWHDEVIEPDWNDPVVQAEALAAAEITVRWIEPPRLGDPAAARPQRVQRGRDFEQFVMTHLQSKHPGRFFERYRYNPPPLNFEMHYHASALINGEMSAWPVPRPREAPHRVQRQGNRTRISDGFIRAHAGTHGRGTMIESKCLGPFVQFDPERHRWAWMMQVAFAAQLMDYIGHVTDSWGRGARGTPPVRIQYYFCEAQPYWVKLLMATTMAAGTAPGWFADPDVLGPRNHDWIQQPVWYPDPLGIAQAAGTAIENWEGLIPWGNHGGDWLMNVTSSIYDELSGSE